jgi:hypothetical protein
MGTIRYPFKDILVGMGHSVDVFDWSHYFYSTFSSNLYTKIFDKIFFRTLQKKINQDLYLTAINGKYDVLLVMMGRYIFPATLEGIREKVKILVNWSTDDVWNMKSSSVSAISSIKTYDLIFSPRPHLFGEFISCGAKSINKIDWYPHPGLLNFSRLNQNKYRNRNISFVGSWSGYRERALYKLRANGLEVFGWGWGKHASSKFTRSLAGSHAHISMDTMANIFVESKVNINLFTRENRDTSNLRNFEIPAVAAFQLSERSPDVLQLFDEDKEIVCFGGGEEMLDKSLFYLKNDAAREKIALAGYRRLIKSRHTLESRLDLIVKKINDLLS